MQHDAQVMCCDVTHKQVSRSSTVLLTLLRVLVNWNFLYSLNKVTIIYRHKLYLLLIFLKLQIKKTLLVLIWFLKYRVFSTSLYRFIKNGLKTWTLKKYLFLWYILLGKLICVWSNWAILQQHLLLLTNQLLNIFPASRCYSTT